MGMIPRVSQRKKDVKISKSVVGEGQRREESRWRTRWEKARGHVGFFNGNSWVPDWGVQAGWSNSEARNSKLVVSGLNSHTEMFLRSMRYYTNIWAHIWKTQTSVSYEKWYDLALLSSNFWMAMIFWRWVAAVAFGYSRCHTWTHSLTPQLHLLTSLAWNS